MVEIPLKVLERLLDERPRRRAQGFVVEIPPEVHKRFREQMEAKREQARRRPR